MTDLTRLTQRSATRTIKGVSFPAIIHNMSYFLVDIGVYEDGIVDCWGGLDLPLFKKKLSTGWVKTEIPDGEVLSGRHLAHMTVRDAKWTLTPETLVDRVEATVKALNPSLLNLYDMQGDDTDRSGPIGVMKMNRMSKATWRADEAARFGERPIKGIANKAFWRSEDAVHVVHVSLFDDDMVQITGAGDVESMTLEALRADDRLSPARKGDRIKIAGLCSFFLADIMFTVPKDDFLAELEMDRDKFAGRQTPINRTVAAFKSYNEDPTTETLAKLREAYESVPNHLRVYCGDMDTKDIPIRIALYGEDEIENWSHRAVAKARGDTLPTIKVPKPKDS